jgi:hypothetical protein
MTIVRSMLWKRAREWDTQLTSSAAGGAKAILLYAGRDATE